ncbi:PREDICTED: uncharacterized protein K02A2.6-like [Cyphomyrmex costatus]|uniref:uncharacterized protein K02A2.6-like n=1 Tax=Cyphomyrmex costatus TaxID=456900 RepID=UPI0008524417|nr:PREDICTED: uncharacterized protein K02A2.6-like [Cyphomyrmex costatus]
MEQYLAKLISEMQADRQQMQIALAQQQQQMQTQQQQSDRRVEQLIAQLAQREQTTVITPAATTAKSLAEQMVAFTYDPDNNLTFESWYKRYQTIFTTEVSDWPTAAKIRLLLQKFELHTDHKPLLTIFGSKQGILAYTTSRLQRYALTLLAYDFDIKYVNTGSFGYADVVSRLIAKHPRENKETVIAAIQEGEEEKQCFAIDAAKLLPVKFADIQEATQRCATLKKVIEFTNTSWPQKRNQIQDPDVAAFFDQRETLTVSQNCLLQGDRVVVPSQFHKQILEELHLGHPGCTRMKLLARSKVFWPEITADVKRTVKTCEACATNARSPIKCSLQSWPIPTKP